MDSLEPKKLALIRIWQILHITPISTIPLRRMKLLRFWIVTTVLALREKPSAAIFLC